MRVIACILITGKTFKFRTIKSKEWERVTAMAANADFDLDMAMEYCAGDPDIFRDVLDAYLEQGEEYLQQIPDIMARKDYSAYQIIAHAIKSTSKTIGAVEFSEEAKEQEFLIKEGKTEVADAAWQAFLDDFRNILDEAEALLTD